MSFYNETAFEKNNNRIPSDSVIFSKQKFELEDFLVTQENTVTVEQGEYEEVREETIESLKAEIIELLKREESWLSEKNEWELQKRNEIEKNQTAEIMNGKLKEELEAERAKVLLQKAEVEKQVRMFEIEKSETLLKIKGEAYYVAINLLEEMLNQVVDKKAINVEQLIVGMLMKMPSEFSTLKIITSPETKEMIMKNNVQNWIFSGAEWTMDFRMRLGEFILKQDDEYKAFIYEEMLEGFKEIIIHSERIEDVEK